MWCDRPTRRICVFFFLMIRRPPRSTLDRSSAASDVYKRQVFSWIDLVFPIAGTGLVILVFAFAAKKANLIPIGDPKLKRGIDFHL